MSNPITITQCEDDALIRGTGIEVAVHDGGHRPTYYLVGSALEDGTTVILPLGHDCKRNGTGWRLADHTVLDAVEELQTLTVCRCCDGDGIVEEVDRHDLADVREQACDDCDGKGWR